ncbi:MAG: hypothetical protein FWD68_04795 [Alphaproteobacteria bacterium]|nr:hypothetical protein [Alphaproteobacteria bacterium]
MKLRGWMVALAFLGASTRIAPAQEFKSPDGGEYMPRLADIMTTAQMRHHKLWLAGKAQNWPLAAFELRLLKASLVEAALLYSNIPVNNVATLDGTLQSVVDAITERDGRKFAKTVADLTEGCNSCHRSIGRSFVVIKVPVDAQPFGNQVFTPSPARP